MSRLTESLNPQQLHAVKSIEGPLLILAGAGSGKTRVITHRIAYMLGKGIPQSAILAVTFTNKAAREMAHRVRELCVQKLQNMTVSTFHAFGVQVLREHGHHLDYRRNFTIYDETDKQSLIKESARDLGLLRRSHDGFDAYRIASLFSRLKSNSADWQEETVHLQPLFREYQSRLKLFNAVDFDDLIRLPIRLLEDYPEVRSALHQRFRYFMVDEFQDTSLQQYRLIRLLAAESGNLCVVGDDDQSIYSWRGAHFENILQFERDFPTYREVKLEQNYRSTRKILVAANRVILHNKNRKGKSLWSGLAEGESVVLVFPENEQREGEFIAERIRSLALKKRIPLNQFGVLVRTNSQTRAVEEAFVRQNLLYQVSGGMSFFQRKEVKDILAYLRVMANPDDDMNLLRIINTPRRGIGKKTVEAIVATARDRGCSLYSALNALHASAASGAEIAALPDKAPELLGEFHELIENFRSRFLKTGQLTSSLGQLVEELDYWSYLVQEHSRPEVARWKYGNIEGLMDSVSGYEEDPDNLDPNLYEYLNRATLVSRDTLEDFDGRERVNLMTIHAAKGLEFDTVFLAGLERGLIPHARSVEEGAHNLEEERRLFYVAITRAKQRLFLSSCRSRRRRGRPEEAEPSPFLEELPPELIEQHREDEELSDTEAIRLFAEMKSRLGGAGGSD
ncbi:MAG: UvrD-helicase domain-containing protein [Spirochaetaceae bacterium]|nr:MAG: UvrD-helicase domain-containing protein [Spirochaetaceae bacterium]